MFTFEERQQSLLGLATSIEDDDIADAIKSAGSPVQLFQSAQRIKEKMDKPVWKKPSGLLSKLLQKRRTKSLDSVFTTIEINLNDYLPEMTQFEYNASVICADMKSVLQNDQSILNKQAKQQLKLQMLIDEISEIEGSQMPEGDKLKKLSGMVIKLESLERGFKRALSEGDIKKMDAPSTSMKRSLSDSELLLGDTSFLSEAKLFRATIVNAQLHEQRRLIAAELEKPLNERDFKSASKIALPRYTSEVKVGVNTAFEKQTLVQLVASLTYMETQGGARYGTFGRGNANMSRITQYLIENDEACKQFKESTIAKIRDGVIEKIDNQELNPKELMPLVAAFIKDSTEKVPEILKQVCATMKSALDEGSRDNPDFLASEKAEMQDVEAIKSQLTVMGVVYLRFVIPELISYGLKAGGVAKQSIITASNLIKAVALKQTTLRYEHKDVDISEFVNKNAARIDTLYQEISQPSKQAEFTPAAARNSVKS